MNGDLFTIQGGSARSSTDEPSFWVSLGDVAGELVSFLLDVGLDLLL
jgi:hypothetical protein